MIREKECKRFIKFLNEVYKLDPDWLERILSYRPTCNKKLADHPTIQAWLYNTTDLKCGFLGLMNGYFGSYDGGKYKGFGSIGAVFDDKTGKFVKFMFIENE